MAVGKRGQGLAASGAAVAVLLAVAAAHADPPECTARQVAEWKLVHAKQLGMGGRNRDAHYIGANAGRTKASWGAPGDFGGRNWFPADVYRKTLCGPLMKFSLYATPVTGAERDFHPYYSRPSAPFEYLFDELAPVSGQAKDIYGEITLPKAFEHNPPWFEVPGGPALLFNSRTVRSPLEGGAFCVYGPWVWEEFHENQPEIHPAEQMWFRDPQSDKLLWMVLQDASHRFEDPRDFCAVAGQARDCAAGGQPGSAWAPPSVRAEARVGYELSRDRDETTQVTVRHVRRGPRALGPQDKATERLERGPYGQNRLVVRRPPITNDFTVSLGGECTTDGGARLQGYVLIRTDVQTSGGKEGFHVIEVEGPFAPAPQREAVRRAAVEPIPPALESIAWDEGTQSLVGTYRVEGQAVSVPLLGSQAPSGRRLAAEGPLGETVLPSAKPVPRLNDLAAFDRRRAGWIRTRTDIAVSYEAADEGGEGLVDLLNSSLVGREPGRPRRLGGLDRRQPQYRRVFGPAPFTASVRVALKDAAGETQLEPARDCAAPPTTGDAAVCVDDSKGASIWRHNQRVADVFLWVKASYSGEVRLSVELTDPFGQKGETSRTFSFGTRRKALVDGLVPGFVETWAPVAGLEPAALRALWRLEEDEAAGRPDAEAPGSGALCGQRSRRARLFHLYGLFASRDFEIKDSEEASLRKLAAGLREAAEDPPDCVGGDR